MDFDREALESLLNQKLSRAERAIIRNYLKECGFEGDELAEQVNVIAEERAQGADGIYDELEKAKDTISELEEKLRSQKVDFTVREVMARLGVKKDLYDDVKLLAAAGINSAAESGGVNDAAVNAAVSAVIAKIPSVVESKAISGKASVGFTGSMGNFARNDDSASLMKNRLNSARAAGDNALSVSIISEAASMGISLR